MICSIDGFSEIMANKFLENFVSFKEFLNNNTFIKIKNPSIVKLKINNSGLFSNQKIVLTGFRDPKIIDLIEKNNGTITNTISKSTNLLIIKDMNSKSKKIINAQN